MQFFILIVFSWVLVGTSLVFSQDEHELSSIQVRCQYESGEHIPDRVFTFYKGEDSITSAITDENGEFVLELELEFLTKYELLEKQKSSSYPSKPIIIETTYSPYIYVLEITLANPNASKFQGQIAYYQPKEIKKIEEFEVEKILSIIENHPEICIQFSQTIIHSESEKIAKKRKNNFLTFLEGNGVDMTCIQFEDEPRYLRAFDEDQRSRIQGAIYSMESKCN